MYTCQVYEYYRLGANAKSVFLLKNTFLKLIQLHNIFFKLNLIVFTSANKII